MSQNFSVYRYGPTAGTSVSVTATSTNAAQITGCIRIVMNSTVKAHIIFGGSLVAAAQTSDFPMAANTDYVFEVAPGRDYYRIIRDSADGTLIWAPVA